MWDDRANILAREARASSTAVRRGAVVAAAAGGALLGLADPRVASAGDIVGVWSASGPCKGEGPTQCNRKAAVFSLDLRTNGAFLCGDLEAQSHPNGGKTLRYSATIEGVLKGTAAHVSFSEHVDDPEEDKDHAEIRLDGGRLSWRVDGAKASDTVPFLAILTKVGPRKSRQKPCPLDPRHTP